MLCIIALLCYSSAFIMWTASGQDPDMMERKLGQIATGFYRYDYHGADPPRVCMKTGLLTFTYFCVVLLIFVDVFGQISKGAQRWLDLGIIRFQPSEIAKIAVPLMVARFMNRDVCPPTLRNTAIALVLIFVPTLF